MSNNEILTRLKRIEDKLDKSKKVAEKQWLYNLGFAAMIASLGVLQYNVWGAVFVFIAGYLLMILSSFEKKKHSNALSV